MSVNLFSVLDVFENHYFISVCVSVSLLSIFDEFHCQLCIQLCWARS